MEQGWGGRGERKGRGWQVGRRSRLPPGQCPRCGTVRPSLSYLNPKSACGCPDGVFRHLWSPHYCLLPKARGVPNSRCHEHPAPLRPQAPLYLRTPGSLSPGGRRGQPLLGVLFTVGGQAPRSPSCAKARSPSFSAPKSSVRVEARASDGAHSCPWQQKL